MERLHSRMRLPRASKLSDDSWMKLSAKGKPYRPMRKSYMHHAQTIINSTSAYVGAMYGRQNIDLMGLLIS